MFGFKPYLVLALSFFGDASIAGENPTPISNTVKWATASEVENFGYDVFRADQREGPFERLTKQPIAGAGTTDEPQHYQFVDDTIEEGNIYYYYVESISLEGAREPFTPVFPSRPKYAQAD